jgi:hypothetical protein
MRKLPQIKTSIRQPTINENKTKKGEKKMQTTNTQRTQCEVFSRSMGFIRPVSNFNIGKYSEFCERKTFTEQNSLSAGMRHAELMKKAA